MNCPNCGGTVAPGSNRCAKCGSFIEQPQAPTQAEAVPVGPAVKSKTTAGLLGIFLGGLGIHRFYLGYTNIGIIMAVVWGVGLIISIFTCGVTLFIPIAINIWGLVEGILILTGSFDKDSEGRPLIE